MSLKSIFESVVSSFFNALVNWVNGWYEREKRQQAEWAAKAREHQLESMKKGKELEHEMRASYREAVVPTSIEEWNTQAQARNAQNEKLGVISILLCSLVLTGCFRFHSSAPEYKPYLQVPEQPLLSEEVPFEHPDFQLLLKYATELNAVIDHYNVKARESNILHGFEEDS